MQHITLDAEAISGILGSVSIACWVVVFSPQIIENFRRSSAEGLSIVFVVIWLVGDVFNILGAVLQGVLPTMTILAVYYTLADIVLMLQCFYYRGLTLSDHVTPAPAPAAAAPTERSALLADRPHRASFGEHVEADGVRLSPATPMHAPKRDAAALAGRSPAQQRSVAKAVLVNAAAVLVVCAAGVGGWVLSTQAGRRNRHGRPPADERHPQHGAHVHFDVLGQVFGYVCAALYLGSRAPQLLLNYRRKSTEGISLLFFLFACVGNLTYVLSIVVYAPACGRGCGEGEAGRLYAQNLLVNLSWLLGSFGTLLLDGLVFVQFFLYRHKGDAGAG